MVSPFAWDFWLIVADYPAVRNLSARASLAPWEPTQKLVVQGVYRHVRNPMISGVLFVLLGESVLTASLPLFWWFLVFAFINATYIPLWVRSRGRTLMQQCA